MAQFYRPKSKSSERQRRIVQLQVEQLDLHGKGVAWLQGKPVFVPGSLPGERVNVSLSSSRKAANAELLEVLQASPERVEPVCPFYQRCGGCQQQHLSADKQIGYKQQALAHYLQRKGVEVQAWAAPLCSTAEGYRRRARLAIDARKLPARIGFRQEKSSRVSDIPHCMVLTPKLNLALQQLRNLLVNDPAIRQLGHIDLLEAEAGVVAVVWLRAEIESAKREPWLSAAAAAGLRLQLVAPAQSAAAELSYSLDGLSIGFTANQFIQVNAELNRLMVAQALRWLELQPQDRLLDLFCGVGNFSLPAAKRCRQVIGIEGVPEMVEQAQHNAMANQLGNTEFACMDLSRPGWSRSLQSGFNKLLLDPARAGAEQVALEIDAVKADSLLYVSCSPATLVRDAKLICQQGYVVAKAGVMDMFPHTQHVESMLLFTRRQ